MLTVVFATHLGRFATKSVKVHLLAQPYLLVCMHVTTKELQNEFSRNFMPGSFAKICQHTAILVQIGQKK
jgi:hypothetical protein